MYKLQVTSKYKKDLKRAKSRGLDLDSLQNVLSYLVNGITLPKEYNDHKLLGRYIGYRECHISPDWLLIYDINTEIKLLTLVRTGTHADLF
jgi:mRNA interferase YafQ